MRYWWVNQNQTYDQEVPGGFLRSPVRGARGRYNYFYDTMTELQPGDVVFSIASSTIRAVGVVVHPAEPSVKPDFGDAGGNWSDYGWLVQMEFQELDHPIRPKQHMDRIGPHLPDKYSPLSAEGNGYQHVYLTELSPSFASTMIELLGGRLPLEVEDVLKHEVPVSLIELELAALLQQSELPETERRQLVNARVGQGLSRNNVRLNEHARRVTGVHQLHHLRASHIKPWKDSDNAERLHGCNGLLLAPHVEHPFDRGFISFDDDGDLLGSPRLEPDVLSAWAIELPRNVGTFNVDQRYFLGFHRQHVFAHV